MIPGNSESKKALADGTYQQKSFKAHRTIQWDYPVIGTDNVGADFEVTYEYNGSCVANVRMTNTSYAPGAPLSGHEPPSTPTSPSPSRQSGTTWWPWRSRSSGSSTTRAARPAPTPTATPSSATGVRRWSTSARPDLLVTRVSC